MPLRTRRTNNRVKTSNRLQMARRQRTRKRRQYSQAGGRTIPKRHSRHSRHSRRLKRPVKRRLKRPVKNMIGGSDVTTRKDGDGLSDSRKQSMTLVYAEARKYPTFLGESGSSYTANKDVVMVAVQEFGNALQYASSGLQNDKEIVLKAIKIRHGALYYASPGLQKDPTVILTAIDGGDPLDESIEPLNYAGRERDRHKYDRVCSIILKTIAPNEFLTDARLMEDVIEANPRLIQAYPPSGDNYPVLAIQSLKKDIQSYVYIQGPVLEDPRIFLYMNDPKDEHFSLEPDIARTNAIQELDKVRVVIQQSDITQDDRLKLYEALRLFPYSYREDARIMKDCLYTRFLVGPFLRSYLDGLTELQLRNVIAFHKESANFVKASDLLKLRKAVREELEAEGRDMVEGVLYVEKPNTFRMGIEIECCGVGEDGEDLFIEGIGYDCFETGSYNGYRLCNGDDSVFTMDDDSTVKCRSEQCSGEIILSNTQSLLCNGREYTVEVPISDWEQQTDDETGDVYYWNRTTGVGSDSPPDSVSQYTGDFIESLKGIGDNLKPSFGYVYLSSPRKPVVSDGGRLHIHISDSKYNYGSPEGLSFAQTLLCLWTMEREGDTYQARFKLMGHSSENRSAANYATLSQAEMFAEFNHSGDITAQCDSFKQLLQTTIIGDAVQSGRTGEKHIAGMYFYSLFAETHKYNRVSDWDEKVHPIRLEFRGFHNVLKVAESLAEIAKTDKTHPLHGKSMGDIFSTYVDRHMKDLHFFFDLAYKTSGIFSEYEEATQMVRNGRSLDEIISRLATIDGVGSAPSE